MRAEVFLAELPGVREVRSFFGEELKLQPRLTAQLQSLATDRRAREAAVRSPVPPESGDLLAAELRANGFRRELRSFQLQNLACDSPPTAWRGLLSPRCWQDDSGTCRSYPPQSPRAGEPLACDRAHRRVPGMEGRLARVSRSTLRESLFTTVLARCFRRHADIVLTNYNRVAADYDRIRDYVAASDSQVILDEAHRIKRGALGVHGRAVLDLAYVAKRRDVLTGTPSPQGAFDLIALIDVSVSRARPPDPARGCLRRAAGSRPSCPGANE